jgi:transcriptional regulator GlxA family with amidase domain
MYHNLGRTLPLRELAQRTGVSVSRLGHLFKNEIGTSPKQYLKWLRLHRAKCLLEGSPLSVKEVAGQVGLTTGALIRDFRRAYGVSPGCHRHRLRGARLEAALCSEQAFPSANAAELAYK